MKFSIFSLVVIGSIALSSCTTSPTTTTTSRATTQSNANVRIINGKRYVFVPGQLDSNLPGRWVPEDSPAAQAASASATQWVSRGQIQNLQTGGR